MSSYTPPQEYKPRAIKKFEPFFEKPRIKNYFHILEAAESSYHLFVNLEDKSKARKLLNGLYSTTQNVHDVTNFIFPSQEVQQKALEILRSAGIEAKEHEETQPGLFEEDLQHLDDCLEIHGSDGNWNYDDYMLGMYNGMALSKSLVTSGGKEDPGFRRAPTLKDVEEILESLGFSGEFSLSEVWKGMMRELKEHGDTAGDLDVLPGYGSEEWISAVKIVLSHLQENPHYYSDEMKEFTVYDLKAAQGSITKRTAGERAQKKGTPDRGAEVISFEPSTGIIEWLIEPTDKFSSEELDARAKPAGNTSAYKTEVQLENYRDWVSSPGDEYGVQAWKKMDVEGFKEILSVADIKLFCSCYGFNYWGYKYQLTQAGAAIYPQTIPDAKRSKQTGMPRPQVCKHCVAVLDKLVRKPEEVLKQIQEVIH